MYSTGLRFASNSIRVTRAVDWTGEVYRTVSYYAGVILGGALFLMVGIPLLRLSLYLASGFVKRNIRSAPPKVTTAAQYRRLRIAYDKISAANIHILSIAGVPTLVKRLGLDALNRQILQLADLRDRFKSWLETALQSVEGDKEVQGALFTPVSEDTLWNNRTTAYDYKL